MDDTKASDSHCSPRFALSERMAEIEKIAAAPEDVLLEKIEIAAFKTLDESRQRCVYQQVRSRLLILNLAMNLQQKIAPAFRPMRRPGKPAGRALYSDENTLLSNDRQLIDLHWIYCSRMSVRKIMGYRNLFNQEQPFDWPLAVEFAAKAGRYERKSQLLGLAEIDEMQLMAIRSKKIVTRFQTIKRLLDKNGKEILELFTAPSTRYDQEVVDAITEIYTSILIARSSPVRACSIYCLMTGRTFPTKRMSRCINKLSPYLYKDT